MTKNHKNKIIIGRLNSAYGIKGWLHLTSFTDPIDNILDYPNWLIQKNTQWVALPIEAKKKHGKGIVVKVANCDDRTTAEKYKGSEIAIDRADLPEPESGTYYWSDLIGFKVITVTGNLIGTVDYIFETGANDVIATTGKTSQLIPFTKQTVKKVDLAEKTITVDWEPL